MIPASPDLVEVPLVAACSSSEELPAFLATMRAEVDAGRWFAWLTPEPDSATRTSFIVGAEGSAFRIRDAAGRPVGIYADFGSAIVAGLRFSGLIA